MSATGNTDEDRIVDEALKRLTGNKVRIEDVNNQADIKMKLVSDMVKDVLHKIIENGRDETVWAISNGAPPPDHFKVLYSMQGLIMIFIQELLDCWTTTSGIMMSKEGMENFKRILDRFDAH